LCFCFHQSKDLKNIDKTRLPQQLHFTSLKCKKYICNAHKIKQLVTKESDYKKKEE
jgi:methylthioribose-1-phosphate isomerase